MRDAGAYRVVTQCKKTKHFLRNFDQKIFFFKRRKNSYWIINLQLETCFNRTQDEFGNILAVRGTG